MKYDIGIVIGRMQILHNGHLECIKKTFENSKHVLICIGSCNSPRTIENPFSFEERFTLVQTVIDNLELQPYHTYNIIPLNDYLLDNNKWKKQITNEITKIEDKLHTRELKVAIIGGSKNEWYFDLFKEYDSVYPELTHNKNEVINAKDIRFKYFNHLYFLADRAIEPLVPKETFDFLVEYRKETNYAYIAAEWGRINDLNKNYGFGPFLTGDTVLVYGNKVLLIKRKNHPGRGLYALPGGYFDMKDESLIHCAYRELVEETSCNLTLEEYSNGIFKTQVFDAPKRSLVARIITKVCYVDLPFGMQLDIKANDDAAECHWFTFEEIKDMKHMMYDDHYEIISQMPCYF